MDGGTRGTMTIGDRLRAMLQELVDKRMLTLAEALDILDRVLVTVDHAPTRRCLEGVREDLEAMFDALPRPN
jgi:hypothetical protein